MSTKQKKRVESLDKRDNQKFFKAVGIAVLILMVLLFLVYKSMN